MLLLGLWGKCRVMGTRYLKVTGTISTAGEPTKRKVPSTQDEFSAPTWDETQSSTKQPLDSADPTSFAHPITVPLEVLYLEMKSVSEKNSGDSEEDIDNLSVAQFITARSGGTATKVCFPK